MVRGRGLASPLRANSDGPATVVALFALRSSGGDVSLSFGRRNLFGCRLMRAGSHRKFESISPKQVSSRSLIVHDERTFQTTRFAPADR